MRGRGHDIGVVERRVDDSARHEAGDVRHVNHHVRADLVADGTEALVVPLTRVGGAAGDDEFRLEEHGVLFELVVVDVAGLLVEAVRKRLEVDRRGRDALLGSVEAVGEVTAMREVETHDAVVRLEQASVDRHVGRRARVRLAVDAPLVRRQAERSASAVNAHVLDHVNILVATVVASTRKTFRVLVGEARAVGLHHALGGEVLRTREVRQRPRSTHAILKQLGANSSPVQSKQHRWQSHCGLPATHADPTLDPRRLFPPNLWPPAPSLQLAVFPILDTQLLCHSAHLMNRAEGI